MAPTVSPLVSVVRRGHRGIAPRDADRTVLQLRGEHDASTTVEVTIALARAIALEDCDLVVDLSAVEFMGAETIGILVRTRVYLELRSRSLTLRSPSRATQRLIDVCGLTDLVEGRDEEPTPRAVAALPTRRDLVATV